MDFRRAGLIGLAGLTFGSSVVMTRYAVSEFAPLTLVAVRLGVASLSFAVILLAAARRLPADRQTWLGFLLVGVINVGVPMVANTLALQLMSSATLTLFIALIPLLTGALAHFWLPDERLTLTRLAGLGIALSGVALLIVTRTTGLTGGAAFDLRGPLLALLSIGLGAVAAVYTRLRLRQADVLVLTGAQIGIGLLFVLPFALGTGLGNLGAVTWRGWLAVAYAGLIGSSLALLLIFYMIKHYGPVDASLATYLMPVTSAALGAWLLGEVVTPPLVISGALVILGLIVASRRARPVIAVADS